MFLSDPKRFIIEGGGGGVNSDFQQQQQPQQQPPQHPFMYPPPHMFQGPPPPAPGPHPFMFSTGALMPPHHHPSFNALSNSIGAFPPPNMMHPHPHPHHIPPPHFAHNLSMSAEQIPLMNAQNDYYFQQQQQQQHLHNLNSSVDNIQQQQQQSSTDSSKPTLSEVFDDLSTRFVLNIPSEELESFERLLFQIEMAYWFYDDFYREDHPSLPKYSLSEFTKVFFNNCPLLKPHRNNVEEILKKFSEYKTRVPVFGAIILNQDLDKALFVKGFGSSNSWGFPKGKVNKDEPDGDCAIREVLEETGFDSTPYLNENHYIESFIKEQKIKLYIIAGVPEETYFYPRTRKEISKIEWIAIDDLPTINKKTNFKERNFYRAIPFFNKLRRWIANRKAKYTKEFYPTTPHNSSRIRNNNNNNNNINNNNNNNNQNTNITPKNTNSSGNIGNSGSLSKPQPSAYSPYPMSPPASPRDNNMENTPIQILARPQSVLNTPTTTPLSTGKNQLRNSGSIKTLVNQQQPIGTQSTTQVNTQQQDNYQNINTNLLSKFNSNQSMNTPPSIQQQPPQSPPPQPPIVVLSKPKPLQQPMGPILFPPQAPQPSLYPSTIPPQSERFKLAEFDQNELMKSFGKM
ncbi:hypothetical protein CYY_007446 [Polysphondylium violaceum]|uniref:Nudix hydrolase domain-containing protein n=1 Tax=Polysphondylium violaceum TaxID=133409 RepID=A0A8J4PPM6_9MYCE|nr:hypothetical protein CYY_007446 [Polysphondylium violaceum]